MKSLLYILKKSVKNGFLELKKKPAKLIAYFIFLAFLILGTFASKSDIGGQTLLDPELYSTIAGIAILIFTLPDIYSSINNGASFFRGADINLVFTSPTSPQKVLVYGFLKQIYATFMMLFFILFQGPNLYRFSNIKPYAITVIVFGLFLMLIFNSIFKILLYSLASKSEKNKALIKNILKLFGLILIIVYFIELYILKSPGNAIKSLLNSPVIPYIPVYGWVRGILLSSINGITTTFFIYIALIILVASLCSYIVYSMKLDYYEDVLASTELKETTIAASRRGEKVFMATGKKPKVRKVEYVKKGNYASAIFWRQILEYKKTGFALINVGSVIYAVIGITAGLFSPIKDLTIVLGIMIYLQLIFTFANKWQKDLSNPYIFLIPDHSFKKVIYSTAVDNIKNLIDGTIVFVITGILFKSNLILIVINIIAFVAIGTLFIYGGILSRRLLGPGDNLIFASLMRIGILFLILIPGVILLVVLYTMIDSFAGTLIAYATFIGYNIVFSGIILLLGKGVFENIEV